MSTVGAMIGPFGSFPVVGQTLTSALPAAQAMQPVPAGLVRSPFSNFGTITSQTTDGILDQFSNPALARITRNRLVTADEAKREQYEQGLQRLEEQQLKDRRRRDADNRAWTIMSTALGTANRLYNNFVFSRFYSLRNLMPTAIKYLTNGFSDIEYGRSFLTGSSAFGVDPGILASVSGMFQGMEGDLFQQLRDTTTRPPSDEALLALTGRDQLGRTILQRRQENLAGMPLATTPIATILSEISDLALPASSQSSSGVGRLFSVLGPQVSSFRGARV